MIIERSPRPGLKSRATHDRPWPGLGKSGGRPSVARDFNPGRGGRSILLAFLAALATLAPLRAQPPKVTATAVLAEFDHLAALPLWPDFDPRKTPLAIYDGERTILVRHPSPPAEFKKEGEIWTFAGKYPVLRANTSTELGGVTTATLLLDPARPRTAREWASVMIHETFHVFQRQHHPPWAGNEAELFVYPMDDAGPLAARRLETEAFRRALAAKEPQAAVCWTGRALDERRERFAKLPAGAVGYERGTELNEGLANFVENLSLGKTGGPDLPASEYGAEEVRARAYPIGFAQAALLDRFDPSWRRTLEAGSAASLDELLARAVAGKPATPCGFTPEETAAAGERARGDVLRLAKSRQESRAAFLGRPGWWLEISSAKPLWPQGFDPLNVTLVAKGEILHRRWVKLGNDDSTLEVLDRESLTQGAGEHPLFNGVKDLQVTGLPAEPKVRQDGEFLVIEAAGVTARLKGGKVEKGERALKVTVP
jgi:hypothetical protein